MFAADSPELRQLIRLTQGALEDGYKDENAALPNRLEKSYVVARLIQDQEARPEQAVLCAYLYGRAWANPELPTTTPPGQRPEPDLLRAAGLKWVRERRQPRPEPPPRQDPDYYDYAFLQDFLLHALAAGWRDEQGQDRLSRESAADIASLLLSNHPRDPHWAVILCYFSSRANSLADKMGRAPTEEPDRWFNQSMLNWLQDRAAE